MAVIVVGGHTRNIGKTSVVAGLIAGMPERAWTAIKITQFGHGVCSANGEPCDCETAEHTIAVTQERQRGTGTDTSRYLDAGAAQSFWVRTRQGQLHEAMPRVRQLLRDSEHCIVESNSVLRFLKPDVFVSVLDPDVADFKESALHYLDRADAIVTPESLPGTAWWPAISPSLVERCSRFSMQPPQYCSAELVEFVRERSANCAPSAA